MSDVALIFVPAVHTRKWFSKYSINREQLILGIFIYDTNPHKNFSVTKCIKDMSASTSVLMQVLDCRASTEQFSAISQCVANTIYKHIIFTI
jgi:hypothetical protein